MVMDVVAFCVRSVVEWWAGLSGDRIWRRGGLFWRETLIKMAGRKMAGSLGSVVVMADFD